MIKVTRINGDPLVINADLIEFVEASPETIICLTTGKKIMVKQEIDEIIDRVAAFKRKAGIRTIGPDTADQLTGADHG
jgi:flagellar protein FlbD